MTKRVNVPALEARIAETIGQLGAEQWADMAGDAEEAREFASALGRDLGSAGPLSSDTEHATFRYYNYARSQTWELLRAYVVRPTRANRKVLDNWWNEARRVEQFLVSCNQGLVIHFAARAGVVGDDHEDAIHDGIIGVVQAIRRFLCSRGHRFSSFAAKWIVAIYDRRLTSAVPGTIEDQEPHAAQGSVPLHFLVPDPLRELAQVIERGEDVPLPVRVRLLLALVSSNGVAVETSGPARLLEGSWRRAQVLQARLWVLQASESA